MSAFSPARTRDSPADPRPSFGRTGECPPASRSLVDAERHLGRSIVASPTTSPVSSHVCQAQNPHSYKTGSEYIASTTDLNGEFHPLYQGDSIADMARAMGVPLAETAA